MLFEFTKELGLIIATSITFCTKTVEPTRIDYCVDDVVECVLDGETMEWCKDFYIETTKE